MIKGGRVVDYKYSLSMYTHKIKLDTKPYCCDWDLNSGTFPNLATLKIIAPSRQLADEPPAVKINM